MYLKSQISLILALNEQTTPSISCVFCINSFKMTSFFYFSSYKVSYIYDELTTVIKLIQFNRFFIAYNDPVNLWYSTRLYSVHRRQETVVTENARYIHSGRFSCSCQVGRREIDGENTEFRP